MSIGLGSILTIVFVVLRLTDNIDWSWWWVLSPLWISAALTVVHLRHRCRDLWTGPAMTIEEADTFVRENPGTSLTRRVIDLDREATEVLIGMVASHFTAATDLSAGQLERYVDEAEAVTRTHRYTYPSGGES